MERGLVVWTSTEASANFSYCINNLGRHPQREFRLLNNINKVWLHLYVLIKKFPRWNKVAMSHDPEYGERVRQSLRRSLVHSASDSLHSAFSSRALSWTGAMFGSPTNPKRERVNTLRLIHSLAFFEAVQLPPSQPET